MITFQTLTPEEKFNRALAEIYTILLKLADEKENVPKRHLFDSDGRSELLQQNTHPKYNDPHGTVAHGPRSRRVKRLSPRLRQAAGAGQKGKRQEV